MKVAIMGAGIAGLSCALILEKHGINPIIFEKGTMVGDRFINGEALLNVINRPVNNCLRYFSESFGMQLKPISAVREMVFHSKNSTGVIKGNLGYTNVRGRHKYSFENQLFNQIKSKVIFNSEYTYEELKENFDFVVMATGDGAYTERLGNYRCDLTTTLKGATVQGVFKKDTPILWIDYDFVPQGYAYLIPFSEREANITIAYPDSNENIRKNPEDLWERFLHRASTDTKQDLKIIDNFQIRKYMIGRSYKPIVNNTLFTGNCFGAIRQSFGFGQFNSILTGIFAAHHILGKGDYEVLTKFLYKNYEDALVIRKFMGTLNNSSLDKLIPMLNFSLVNKTFGDETQFDYLKFASYFLRPITLIKH